MASFSENDDLVDSDDDRSPGDEQGETYTFKADPSSPSKRIKLNEVKASAISSSDERFYIELCQGGVELITLEMQPPEVEPHVGGFLKPCRDAILGHSRSLQNYNFITFVTFRASEEDPTALMNPIKIGASKAYPFQGIARLVNNSNHRSRKKVLDALAKVSNDYHRSHPPPEFKGNHQAWAKAIAKHPAKYVVPDDYDQTPLRLWDLQKLDHYLTPAHVVAVIHKIFHNVDHSWAQNNPDLAKQFFSEPYPDEAVHGLGYRNDTNNFN